jgi:lysophospholipase L1-like esterase
MVAFGDSTANMPWSWARFISRMSGGKIRLVNNACIAGETSAQIASRWSRDGEPWKPDIVAIQMGTNDSVSSSIVVPQYLALIKKACQLASNPYVFVLATIPTTSISRRA